MGKKKKKLKKYEKDQKKYINRRDFLLSQFDEAALDIWFGDDIEERNKFGEKLIRMDDLLKESESDILSSDNRDSVYDRKMKKIENKVCHNPDDIAFRYEKICKLERKEEKLKKKYAKIGNDRDFSILRYLDGKKKYGKKFLDKDEYRAELKKIAKNEKNDMKVMRKLGYIKSKNVDDELKKIKEADKRMEIALSDSYTQKHFLK